MSEDRVLTVDSIESTESFLSSNGIEFETIRHPAVMTVEEMVPHKGLFGTEGVVMAKHLFLHDKKKKDAKAWLVVAGPDEKIDLKLLAKYVGVSPGNFRAADGDVLHSFLGCQKGNVNYFAAINDKQNQKVEVLYSQDMYDLAEWQSFHPMDNSASTRINRDGVTKIRDLSGKSDQLFRFVQFGTLAEAVAEAETAAAAQKKSEAPNPKKKNKANKSQKEVSGQQQHCEKGMETLSLSADAQKS